MAVPVSMHPPSPAGQPHADDDQLGILQAFRAELYDCLVARADALMDLVDALCCSQHVASLAHLSLEPAFARDWAAAYAALARGRIDAHRLRGLLATTPPLPGAPPVYAIDVTTWPRRAAACSPSGNGTTIRCGTPAASRWWPPGCTRGCAGWA